MHGQLRGSDDTEAFRQVEVIWETYELKLPLLREKLRLIRREAISNHTTDSAEVHVGLSNIS